MGTSLVLHFDEGPLAADLFEFLPGSSSDLEVLGLPPHGRPTGAVLPLKDGNGSLTIAPYGEGSAPVLQIPRGAALTDCAWLDSHHSVILAGIAVQVLDHERREVGFKQIGLLLIIDRKTMISRTALGRTAAVARQTILVPSITGTRMEFKSAGPPLLVSQWRSSHCVVLGKDTGAELSQLVMVKDRLSHAGFPAHLIKDLPEVREMSNMDKAAAFCQLARFVVVVDIAPTGHLAEMERLRSADTIVATLRPKGTGSSWMVADPPPDVTHHRVFEFEASPLEVAEAAASWADRVASDRAAHYDGLYPWRRSPNGLLRGNLLPES